MRVRYWLVVMTATAPKCTVWHFTSEPTWCVLHDDDDSCHSSFLKIPRFLLDSALYYQTPSLWSDEVATPLTPNASFSVPYTDSSSCHRYFYVAHFHNLKNTGKYCQDISVYSSYYYVTKTFNAIITYSVRGGGLKYTVFGGGIRRKETIWKTRAGGKTARNWTLKR